MKAGVSAPHHHDSPEFWLRTVESPSHQFSFCVGKSYDNDGGKLGNKRFSGGESGQTFTSCDADTLRSYRFSVLRATEGYAMGRVQRRRSSRGMPKSVAVEYPIDALTDSETPLYFAYSVRTEWDGCREVSCVLQSAYCDALGARSSAT